LDSGHEDYISSYHITGCELLDNNMVMEYPFSIRPLTIIQDDAGFYQFALDENVSGNQFPNRQKVR